MTASTAPASTVSLELAAIAVGLGLLCAGTVALIGAGGFLMWMLG